MSAKLWMFAAYMALQMLVTVARVGCPRDPITPAGAVCSLVGFSFVAWLAPS